MEEAHAEIVWVLEVEIEVLTYVPFSLDIQGLLSASCSTGYDWHACAFRMIILQILLMGCLRIWRVVPTAFL